MLPVLLLPWLQLLRRRACSGSKTVDSATTGTSGQRPSWTSSQPVSGIIVSGGCRSNVCELGGGRRRTTPATQGWVAQPGCLLNRDSEASDVGTLPTAPISRPGPVELALRLSVQDSARFLVTESMALDCEPSRPLRDRWRGRPGCPEGSRVRRSYTLRQRVGRE